MKKIFVSMMVATALLAGGSAYAQSQTDGTTGATSQKAATQQCDNCDKAGKGKKEFKGEKRNKAPKFNPFDGVQLTDDQQQRLQVLQQGLGPVELSKEQQAKIPENKNLTEAQKKQLKEERKAQKLQAKKNYLNGVKEILTPEQYVVFLENVYLYSPQDQGKGMKHSDKMKTFNGKKGEKKSKSKK